MFRLTLSLYSMIVRAQQNDNRQHLSYKAQGQVSDERQGQ